MARSAGVVVGKDEAVHAQVQFRRQGAQILILGVPVGLDRHEIVRPQHAVGVVEPRQRVGLVIFGIDRQDHADAFQRLAVALELGVDLPFRHLGADGQAVHPVVPHDAAPERVVQVQHQRLFVAPVKGFDDVGHAARQRRDSVQAHGILVHVPVERVPPGRQAVVRREVVDVVDVEMLMGGGVGVELLVQAADEVGAPVYVPDIAVAHQPVVGAVEVVLDDPGRRISVPTPATWPQSAGTDPPAWRRSVPGRRWSRAAGVRLRQLVWT